MVGVILNFIKGHLSWFLVGILALLLWWSHSTIKKQNAEIERKDRNTEALVSDVEVYKTKYGSEVARSKALELDVNEARLLAERQAGIVEELELKLRRVESMMESGVNIRDSVVIQLRDSVVYDTVSGVLGRPFEFVDTWTRIEGVVLEDHIRMSYSVRDTINQIVYRIPKKFWFIRWGTKGFEQYIRMSNPHSHVVYNQTVLFTKRKHR